MWLLPLFPALAAMLALLPAMPQEPTREVVAIADTRTVAGSDTVAVCEPGQHRRPTPSPEVPVNRVLLAALLLLCTGCFYDYPIAAPSEAITDDAIVGLWHIPEGQDLTQSELMILALPRQQYLVTMITDPEERNSQPPEEPCEHAITGWAVAQTQFLAYIVEVDGRRFLTLQSACGEEGYAFARYWIRGDTARFMTPDEDGDTPEDAARVPALLGDEFPDTIVAYRVQRRSLPIDWGDSQ